jgi:hypothetical protein
MTSKLTDEQLRDKALDVLTTHLGPSQAMRFLSWLRTKPRDYQTWRDAHFRGFTVDDLISQMRAIDADRHAASH